LTHTHVSTAYDTYIIVICHCVCHFVCLDYYSLSQLTQLEKLDIGGNTLKTAPDVVSSLTSLKQLDMISCGISSLPERFVCHMFIISSSHHNNLPLNYIYT